MKKHRSFEEVQAWQLKEIEEALKIADSKNARFFDHEKVCEWISSWGTKNEKKRCDFFKLEEGNDQ